MGSPYPTRIRRILLIDDDEQFARAMAYSLERKFGAQVLWTDDPGAAAGRLADLHDVDLVLADWAISELTSGQRLMPAKIPLVVLTAFDGGGRERERMLKHLFSFLGVVSKEQTLDGMLDNIEIIFANHGAHPNA